ncbi:hypothetical protein ABZ454_10825 [Streptomyces sp. NPDC005803]|uniref:hypothetical protein n=1 Tax=Streptomyces sp. NPDC005803 TaxID=3154297 RepID=UPI0033DE5E6E
MEWEQKGHYETESGDRVTVLELGGSWKLAWSYGWPHCGLQLIDFGTDGGRAVTTFTSSREGKALTFDSREAWQNGSV